jgi:uncharacterized membrane protein YhhN
MALSTVFLVLFVVCSIIHLAGEFLQDPLRQKIRFASKPFLMPLLIVYYVTAVPELGLVVNVLVAIGVVLGFVGDVTLMWPKKQALFMIGLVSFLLGHVLYVIAFVMAMNAFSTAAWWVYLSLIAYGAYFYAALRVFRSYLKEMLVPVVVYMILLLGMSFVALGVVASQTWGDVQQPWYLFIGSLAFIASDSLLANQIFRKAFKYDQVIIMLTYILAQFFIVQGFLG